MTDDGRITVYVRVDGTGAGDFALLEDTSLRIHTVFSNADGFKYHDGAAYQSIGACSANTWHALEIEW